MQITINGELDTPIYQQIVDTIYQDIKSGRLTAGEKLPTVRELADQMRLARGTIKRAYDELGKLGVIQMTQGRGTFVLSQKGDHLGHKERAMKAIDGLLDELEELAFSPREIQIFFDLKLRARLERNSNVRIAVVDCNPEAIATISEQLAPIVNTDSYQFLLDDVLRAPYKLDDNIDLVVTTATHSAELEKVLPDASKVVRVAMAPAQATVVAMAQLGRCHHIGILTVSDKFGRIIQKGCVEMGADAAAIQMRTFGEPGSLFPFLQTQDVLLVPQAYGRFCTQEQQEELLAFGRRSAMVQYDYTIDAGSFMYLEERIEQALRGKRGRG